MGYLGFVAGPPLIGSLATATGLPAALALLALVGAAIAALAGSTRPRVPGSLATSVE
jgi:hypothetical protein